MANFSWLIPQTTLTANGYSVNLNVDRELYLTIANLGPTYGGGNVTISASWQDSSGAGQTATVIAGSTFGPSLITVRTFSVSGSGALIIGTLSSSKVSPESLLASAVNVSGTVKTDVGQGTQASNNTTLNFGGTPIDPRDRTWTLGASDAPNRGWTLGSTDVPGRGWTLGSSDVPGRGWTLGTGDVPVIQGETPTAGTYKPVQTDANGNLLRGWTLGSADVPGRGWTLGSSDVPGRGWTLGSGDQPDITANQSKALGTSTLPVYIRTLGSSDTPKPIGSNGGAFTQDTTNNLQHVPVLQGTSTPIHTKALQYDSNNYPLHTLGNVIAGGNGGDTILPASTELAQKTGPFSGNISNSSVPSGYKWLLRAVGIGILGAGATLTAANLQLYYAGLLFGSASGGGVSYYSSLFNDTTTRTISSSQTVGVYWYLATIPQSWGGITVNYSPSPAWDVAYYATNTGPASGDTTVLTEPLKMYAGDYLSVYIDETASVTFQVWLFLLGEQVPL